MKKFFRIILLTINLLFVVALFLSTFAGRIPPSRWVGISILSYGFVLLFLCNVLFIIIWLCLSRWEFLLSLAANLLCASFVPLFFQVGGNQCAEPADDVLKLMTFNVHGFNGLDDDTLMTADSGSMLFVSLLDEEQPDAFCLQEFFRSRHVNMVDSLEARGYKYHYGVYGSSSSGPLIFFSRLPIVKVHVMDKKSKFGVDIDKDGQTVRLCCVHLDSYMLTEEDREGLESLTHAQPDSNTHKLYKKFKETTLRHEREWQQDLLPKVEDADVPFVLMGDFNDTPASYIYQKATELLMDPYVNQGRGFGTTYHGPFPAFRIDYILHSHDFESLSYKRVKTNISDHYPIVVQLRLF